MTLQGRMAVRLAIAAPVLGGALFLSAGSLRFWGGWAFLSVFILGSALISMYLYRRDPALLERRLQIREPLREQRIFRKLSVPTWIAGLALAGLDYRFSWSARFIGSSPPFWLSLLSLGILVCVFYLLLQVFKVNSFAASVVRVEAGQKVISTGPYRFVRHPMYSGLLLMLLFTPLVLGSYLASITFALLIPVVVFRLMHEEKVLRRELAGYGEYCHRVRFRLVPFIF